MEIAACSRWLPYWAAKVYIFSLNMQAYMFNINID